MLRVAEAVPREKEGWVPEKEPQCGWGVGDEAGEAQGP